ncbi:MAG: LysR family transcriptional regulator [Coprobacillaceae bacterium]
MELRILEYFLAIAREESISKAATYLHITQPTLSRQIKDLENEFGKPLFIRGNRKITLTDEGMLLRKRAEEIVNLVEKTEAEMTTTDETINGDIYIGGGESEGMRFIAKVIHHIQTEYPSVHFHLFSGNAEDVTERLDKGLIDFGILIEPADMSKYDFIKLPSTDVWGLLMRKDSELASLDRITPNDLSNKSLICSQQALVKNEISGWLGKDFSKLNIIATYNLIYNASLMVEEGNGYALCLDRLLNTSGDSNLCFKPLEPKLEVGIVLVWKKYQIFPKAAEYFLRKIQQELSSYLK